MTNKEAILVINSVKFILDNDQYSDDVEDALDMAISALEGKDTDVPSRKGVFIPDITVEMFRNASLEGVEDLMVSGEMEDISLPPAQPETHDKRTETHACDIISREKAFSYFVTLWECIGTIMDRDEWEDVCRTTANEIPPAQPEITDEQAIEHLQESGWMQNHDKQMYEMGLRKQLADDSDSYDALLPSAQPG